MNWRAAELGSRAAQDKQPYLLRECCHRCALSVNQHKRAPVTDSDLHRYTAKTIPARGGTGRQKVGLEGKDNSRKLGTSVADLGSPTKVNSTKSR